MATTVPVDTGAPKASHSSSATGATGGLLASFAAYLTGALRISTAGSLLG